MVRGSLNLAYAGDLDAHRALMADSEGLRELSAAEARGQLLPALAEALQSEDSNEGVRAFIEKRKPVWQGK